MFLDTARDASLPDPALLFHGSFGFREVGQQVMPETGLRAAMLMKDLCSFAWVRDTYAGDLPRESWLIAPRHPTAPPRATGTGA